MRVLTHTDKYQQIPEGVLVRAAAAYSLHDDALKFVPKYMLMWVSIKNIARITNAVPVTLYSRISVNVEIVVLNC